VISLPQIARSGPDCAQKALSLFRHFVWLYTGWLLSDNPPVIREGDFVVDKNEQDTIENADRREVMAALLKYSAVVGGASTIVLSSADAVSASAASGGGKTHGHHETMPHFRTKNEYYKHYKPWQTIRENPEKRSFILSILKEIKRLFG
jgi:hypothetical protein